MYSLFQFLYRFRAFLFFILLEGICLWMIVSYNSFQGASFFNTSNYYAANLLKTKKDVISYFSLNEVNQDLAQQNAELMRRLAELQRLTDSSTTLPIIDKSRALQYEFIPARVINNTSRHSENYITIDKGYADGIEPDMGIAGPDGIVGRVKNVSKHFSTGISVLHSGMQVAAKIKGKNIEATVIWDGITPNKGKVLHVVRHHRISKGDTLVTSEYNAVYPEGINIGVISNLSLGGGSSDYDIDLDFTTDFTALAYVYVIKNALKAERDSLERPVFK